MGVSKVRLAALAASHISIAFILHGCGGGSSTTTTTTGTPIPGDHTVADAVNALYQRSDTGLNMHVVDETEDSTTPWLACLTASAGCTWQPLGRLSAVVLNHFAWNDAKKQITTFGTMNTVGWIGTENVTKNLTNCIFPGDGGSTKRSHAGCGCISTHPESCTKDGWDWCPEASIEWEGVCAMRPDKLTEMLILFKQQGFPYNEAVVDGKKWNDDVSINLWAFVVPTGSMGACGTDTKCYTDFVNWYRSYKAQHGEKTILGFDVTNKNSPFATFGQPAADTIVF